MDRKGSALLYEQVAHKLSKAIREGRYPPGRLIPTERELAEQFGVSRHTIRKALTVLEERHWVERVQGKGTFATDIHLSERREESIGIILPSCETEVEVRLINGIQSAAEAASLSIALRVSGQSALREASHITELRSQGVAGFVIMPADEPGAYPVYLALQADGVPFVVLDRKLPGGQLVADFVSSDNRNAGRLGATHLLELGHRRVAFVKHTEDHTSTVVDRIAGYEDAVLDRGLDFVHVGEYSTGDKAIDALREALFGHGVTALITANCVVAADVVKASRHLGLAMPEDFSLVTFDDLSFIQYFEAPLTAIAQESEAIGRKSVELLLDIMRWPEAHPKGELRPIVEMYYPVRLIVRDSSGPPPVAAPSPDTTLGSATST